MTKIEYYECDRCGGSMGEPFATLAERDGITLHFCKDCLIALENWIDEELEN